MHATLFSVKGMMCQNSCGTTVTNALKSVEGVCYSFASFLQNDAIVIHATGTSKDDLLESIEMVGFDATLIASGLLYCHTFKIEGMMCQNSCGTTCTNALMTSSDKVIAAYASFESQTGVAYSLHSSPTKPVDLAEELESVGFGAELNETRPVVDDISDSDVKYLLKLLKDGESVGEGKKKEKEKKKKRHMEFNINMETKRSNNTTNNDSNNNTAKGLRKMYFNVGGMSCASCSASIEKHVLELIGVKEVKVALLAERAEVILDTSIKGSTQHNVTDTIRDLGFSCVPLRTEILRQPGASSSNLTNTNGNASSNAISSSSSSPPPPLNTTIRLRIGGMSCASCSAKIENEISSIPHVLSVSVGLVTEQFVAVVENGGPGIRDIIHAIEDLGFDAEADDNRNGLGNGAVALEESHRRTVSQWRHLFVFSTCFLVPMLLFQKVFVWIPFMESWLTTHVIPKVTWQTLIQLVLSTPVQFYVGKRFYIAAYRGLKHRNCGMDFLIAMGTTAAYMYSIISVVVACMVKSFHGNHFFETSTMLLTFVVMGKLMESHAKGKTSAALTQLMALQPNDALLVDLNKGGEGDEFYFDKTMIDSNSIRTISISLVQTNDVLKVLPGASIPVDGVVVDGRSSCNEAMITGEAMPVDKTVGTSVFGGTVNQNGVMYIRATRVGDNTAIAQIVRLVEEAQTTKAPIQHFADRVSSIFAPTVVTLSILTFFVWLIILSSGLAPKQWLEDAAQSGSNFVFSFLFGIAVLVIACPCALGLATPTAVMVGTGVGAKLGILIKGGLALETAHGIDSVLFDKTGTLTTGIPVVTSSSMVEGNINSNEDESGNKLSPSIQVLTEEEMCILVGCAELNSEHPLSTALLNHAKSVVKTSRNTYLLQEPLDSSIIPGMGMKANVDLKQVLPNNSAYVMRRAKEVFSASNGGTGGTGGTGGSVSPTTNSNTIVEVMIGNRRLMTEHNVMNFNTLSMNTMSNIEESGNTAVAVSIDGFFVGVIGISDEIKPDAKDTIEQMENMGMDVYMVTGDSKGTAHAVGKMLNIPNERIFSEVLPADKADYVKRLQKRGHTVAMVGDGINDSPALAQSDVGIALGSGSQIAIESAEMVIVKNKLMHVLVAFDLSRTVFRRIRMNFVWAMGYNLIGIPIAAGLLYPFIHVGLPPQFAGLAMAFSSVSVVLSSLHLKYYKTPQEREEQRMNVGVCDYIASLPLQLCMCCVNAIFAEDGAESQRVNALNKIVQQRKRGKYSKINEDEYGNEDWSGDADGDFEMV
jgi:Cu+-exporting ATPase